MEQTSDGCKIQFEEVEDLSEVEEKCFSSTEKSPASAILDQNLLIGVDFGAWQFSRRRIINGQIL